MRVRFASGLHGAVTVECTQSAAQAQHGVDRHLQALARNRHFTQLKIHLPVREKAEPQLTLDGLSVLQPLTQLTSLVITRNPAFTGAPHDLSEDDVRCLSGLRSLNFLELCTVVPAPLGLGSLASLAASHLTNLRTLAFGHTSALWRLPQVGELCNLLDPCPFMTDLRLRCCAPPRNAKQLPELLALPLPARLTNFALTFARKLNREDREVGQPGNAGAEDGAGSDSDDDSAYGEYEAAEEPWDSVDHLAPKPGLHVLIVEKGTRVTRMDVNVTVSVSASDLPTLPVAAPSRKPSRRLEAAGSTTGKENMEEEEEEGNTAVTGEAGSEGDAEEDVPPYDVTPQVLAEYNRLLGEELGLQGTLAEPEDLHLGVRLDILEDDEVAAVQQQLQAAVAGAAAVAAGGGGAGMLQLAAQVQATLQHLQQLAGAQAQAQAVPAAQAAVQALEALAAVVGGPGGGPGGGGGGGGFQQALNVMMGQMMHMHMQGNPNGAGNAGAGNHAAHAGGGPNAAAAASRPPPPTRVVQLCLGPLSQHLCYLNLALVPMVTQLAVMGEGMDAGAMLGADTRVAPVVVDVRGGGYTQLKSLAVTGYVDHDCKPATCMSRGWLAHVPTGMPSLEYLAMYDAVPAANDPTAIQALRSLSKLEHLELRPLYLRFTGEVPSPLALPAPSLPPRLLQITLKKVTIPAPHPATAAAAGPSTSAAAAGAGPSTSAAAAAAAGIPDLPDLTHLWLFDCTCPDLSVFSRAPRVEDLRLGGTTTTTPLADLVAMFPNTRTAILDVSHAVVPGWWSAGQIASLASLRCLRALQLDAASLEPPSDQPPSKPAAAPAATAAPAPAQGGAAPASTAGAAPASTAGATPRGAAPAGRFDSDDDSDAYMSTEEDGAGAAAAGAAPAHAGGSRRRRGAGGGGGGPAADADLASVLRALASLTQVTDLTLSFDTPTLFYNLGDESKEGEEDEDGSGHGDHDDDDASSVLTDTSAAEPAAAAAGAAATSVGGEGGREAAAAHRERVTDALLAGQSFATLAALQGLWRLRVGLPHGAVWEDVMDRLLPALRTAMPRAAVEVDVL